MGKERSRSFDLVVVGAGPGGYAAAIRGAQLGLKVALIDRAPPGGACLHRGCIPSKALLAAAEVVYKASQAERIGVRFSPPKIDYTALIESKDAKVGQLSKGLLELFKAHKIEYIRSEARLISPLEVEIEGGNRVSAKNMILATGTEPIRPASFPFDGKTVLTTDELFQRTTLPRSMVIVGGGVIGCEMACAFNLLGCEVSLVELLPTLLAGEERVVSRNLQKTFETRGVDVLLETRVTAIEKTTGGALVRLSSGAALEVEMALVAIGRGLCPDQLGLDRLGIGRDAQNFIQVDGALQTSVKGVYAIGDLTGKTLLAHGAAAEGICAVENIAGHKRAMDYASVPRVTYTLPEIASIGSREEELKAKGVSFRTGRFSYAANAMALLHEAGEGMAMIHVGKDQKVLGATVMGTHAADLIQEVALVMKNSLPIGALMETVHAHPTYSEIIHEAALDVDGMAIHKAKRAHPVTF